MENTVLDLVGNTPLIRLRHKDLDTINFYAKLECFNPTGSIKDRAASYVLKQLIETKEINANTTIIESSSGNFAISLATYCKYLGLKFCGVIDPNILSINERIISSLATEVIKVTERDHIGGYLLTRINKVKEILSSRENYYWMNQYENPYIAHAYYETIGNEICSQLKIDYIFIGVSSGGTITGVSQKVKEVYPDAEVIAVDSIGSVIFGQTPKKRYVPGIGSSIVPPILKKAIIDEVVIVDEYEAIKACNELLDKYALLVGGSAGSVFAGVNKYFKDKSFISKPNVLCLFADKGERYASTIYDAKWVNTHF